MKPTARIFLSYARKDGRVLALKLRNDLIKKGYDVWLDTSDIYGGDDWSEAIEEAIEQCDVAVLVLSIASYQSKICRAEHLRSLRKGKAVIPVKVQEDAEIPLYLEEMNYRDFSDETQYTRMLVMLIEDIDGKASNEFRIKMQQQRIKDGLENRKKEIAEANERRRTDERKRVVGHRLVDMSHHFQNRVQERTKISHLLSEPSTRILSVIGRGGMGKTALVSKILGDIEHSRWHHTDEKIHVDGIIYMSTRTSGISLERVFLDCAVMLGGQREKDLNAAWTNSKLDIREKTSYLLDALEDGFYVILMDNMEDLLNHDGQLEDNNLMIFFDMLLSSANNLRLLITSRIPLHFQRNVMRFDNGITLTEGLPVKEGILMLRELDPSGLSGLRDAPESTLTKAVTLVHGVPRALEIMAGLLANDPFATLDGILENFYEQENVVQELVEENYKRMDSGSRQVMEALAVFGHPMPIVAIDYLLEPYAPGLDVPGIIKRLAQAFIVNVDRETRTITLHPIDREFTYIQIPEEGNYNRKALELRAANYYHQIRTRQDGWTDIEALQPQLAEFEHLVKAESFVAAAHLLNEIDRDYLALWGYTFRLINMRQNIAGKTDEPELEAHNLQRLGTAYYSMSRYEQSISCHEEALKIGQQLKDKSLEARCLQNIGSCHHFLGHYSLAIDFRERALALAIEIDDPLLQSNSLRGLGSTVARQGKYEKALEFFNETLAIYQKLDKKPQMSAIMTNMGDTYYLLGNYSLSLRYYEQGLKMDNESGMRNREAAKLSGLAWVYQAQGEYEKAIANLTRAITIVKETGNRRLECYCYEYLGNIYTDRGLYEKALEYLENALVLSHETKEKASTGSILVQLGAVYIRSGQNDLANEKLQLANEVVKGLNVTILQLSLRIRFTQLYLLIGQTDKALNVITTARDYKTPNMYYLTTVLQGIAQALSGNHEESIMTFNEALQNIEKLQTLSPEAFSLIYARGLVLMGLALVSDGTKQDNYLVKSQAVYQEAVENNPARGVVEEALQLLNTLKLLDKNNSLAPVRAILKAIL